MREKKFTAGPWIVTEGDEWTHDLHTDTKEQGKWTVASCNGRRDEVIANKNLISAAPELLEALEEAEKVIYSTITYHLERCTCSQCKTYLSIQAAIAKAYGE